MDYTNVRQQINEEEDTQHGRYLTFALGNEVYGLEISFVREIVGMQPVTPLPEVPRHVKGIINLRGKIIPVVSVRLKFSMEEAAYSDRTCIVIIDTAGATVGLIVDGVAEVVTIDDGDIVPPPQRSTGMQSNYLKAIGKIKNEVKLLLDCEKLVTDQEFAL